MRSLMFRRSIVMAVWRGAAVVAALFGVVASATAQESDSGAIDLQRLPRLPHAQQRSGFLSRWIPIEPSLPPDPDRDQYYNMRWADQPGIKHANSCKTGGMYGFLWKGGCTACYPPNFHGSAGQHTLGPQCQRQGARRWIRNFVHPWEPVGTYYAGGCYSPIYDLDPLVTGPGPFPFPWFFKRPTGG